MVAEAGVDRGSITLRTRVLKARTHLSILLLDDNAEERALLTDRLSRRGFDVTQVSDGSSALAVMERRRAPVLLADWTMPLMSGIELTEQLRARGESELLARVHAAFQTFALRCELRQTRAALAAATSALTDPGS
jgi:CheY-like chemotaxis protein